MYKAGPCYSCVICVQSNLENLTDTEKPFALEKHKQLQAS